MNKKFLLVFVLMMFLFVPMVTAVKIDYSPNEKAVEDMKVKFSDTILFGLIKTGEQGTMELKSHETPKQILRVGAGEQVTMYYDFNFKDAYINGIGDVKFVDMRTGKEVKRDYKTRQPRIPDGRFKTVQPSRSPGRTPALEAGESSRTSETTFPDSTTPTKGLSPG